MRRMMREFAMMMRRVVSVCLGMRVALSMQSIWDPRLIVPPNSPMMGDGCLKFPEFPLIDLDELDLRFIERPTSPTIIRPTSSKINLHCRLLRPFILRRVKASVQKHVNAQSVPSSPAPAANNLSPENPVGRVPEKPFAICSALELTLLVNSLFRIARGSTVDARSYHGR